MNAKEILEWIEKEEANGHYLIRADDPVNKTRGLSCVKCDRTENYDAGLIFELQKDPNVSVRAASCSCAHQYDDFSMTQHYFHEE